MLSPAITNIIAKYMLSPIYKSSYACGYPSDCQYPSTKDFIKDILYKLENYEYLKNDFPNMSVATIYNNINFFKKAGIITELPFADGSSRFDLTKTHHYHVICANCGKVEDFDYPNFEEAERIAEKQTHFKVINHSFKVTGICLECQELLNQ